MKLSMNDNKSEDFARLSEDLKGLRREMKVELDSVFWCRH